MVKKKVVTPQKKMNILLVEDDDTIMDISEEMIEIIGHHVLSAKTGTQAVSIANKFKGDIDLAILDIGLPDMDGKKAYQLLKKARPNLKVIVCSGYPIEKAGKGTMDEGAQGFLHKPFTFNELSNNINVALDRRSQPRFKVVDHTIKKR